MPQSPSLDRAAADALRATLAPWSLTAVREVIGERAAAALDREQVVPARLAARAVRRDRVALLTRLFGLGDVLTRAEADLALEGYGVGAAARAGLVRVAGAGTDDAVIAAVDLRPYETDVAGEARLWWVASDLGEAVTGRELADDHVLGVGGASLTLASITMRSAVGRVLDLGTGCGIQALHAAGHAREVVGTDISRRALAFARFNATLNGPVLLAPPGRGGTVPVVEARTADGGDAAPLLDWREGSMLDPVVGERFDLVVSNPPFVITPPGAPRFEYRDAGVGGDAVVAGLFRSIGGVLAPGGVAQMLGNWEIRRGQHWSERLEGWLDEAGGEGMDAWVVQRDVLDAAQYAETWLRDAGIAPERDRSRFEQAYEAYVTDFDARGVEAVGFGIVTLRRPADAAARWRRFEELQGPMQEPLGAHVAQVLAAQEWLAGLSDEDLLATALVAAPDVTRETYGRVLLADPEHILIRQGGGFGRAVKADTALAGFVGACDGELTAGQIAGALAALLDVPAETMVAGLVPAVRELVLDGMLVRG